MRQRMKFGTIVEIVDNANCPSEYFGKTGVVIKPGNWECLVQLEWENQYDHTMPEALMIKTIDLEIQQYREFPLPSCDTNLCGIITYRYPQVDKPHGSIKIVDDLGGMTTSMFVDFSSESDNVIITVDKDQYITLEDLRILIAKRDK